MTFIVMKRLLVLSGLLCVGAHCIVTRRFHRGTLCDMKERLKHRCSTQVNTTRPASVLECVASCNTNNSSVGASFDEGRNCFFHWACPQLTGCAVPAEDHNYFLKVRQPCNNGGHFDIRTGKCTCVDSWVGPSCEDHPRNCSDLSRYGYSKGRYKALLDPYQNGSLNHLIPVSCHINAQVGFDSVSVLIHRGNTNFNLTWQEYTQGFHHQYGDRDLWIGLDHWHAISQMGYNQLFIVLNFGRFGLLYRTYRPFHVQGRVEKFRFSFNESWENGKGQVMEEGNKLLDCLGAYQNTSFSTWDNDNDEIATNNCAAEAGVGWWYRKCHTVCNLFGWGEGHKGSKPSNQIMSVDGIDLDKWLPELVYVYIYVQMLEG